MLCIILLTADVPIICAHRLDTTWIIALSNEGHLVLCNLRQVHTTLANLVRCASWDAVGSLVEGLQILPENTLPFLRKKYMSE